MPSIHVWGCAHFILAFHVHVRPVSMFVSDSGTVWIGQLTPLCVSKDSLL